MLESEYNITREDKRERLCSFYASDYHFEMISIPFIQKEIKDKNKIVILTENNLEETVKTVLNRTNLNENDKNEIMKIGWNKNNEEKIENLKEEKLQEQTIFIKGSKDYINLMENQIKNINSNTKTIHCYQVQEVAEEMGEIVKRYDGILNTIGKIDM